MAPGPPRPYGKRQIASTDALLVRVFLAGGTGHVGGGILAELIRQGHEATVLSRGRRAAALDSRVRHVRGDVAEPSAYAEHFRGHDACIQAAGLLRRRGPNTFQRVVVDGTRNLVAACKAASVPRFLLISANGIDSARTPYQRTKLEAERIVKESGLAYTIFRPSTVYGPTDDFTTRFARMMRWGVLPIPGRGDYRLAPVGLGDLAAAVVKSLGVSAALNRTFPVCGPQSLTYKELLGQIRTAAGRRCLLLPLPAWTVKWATAALDLNPRFPVTPDAITMLMEGNECADQDWVRLFQARPVPVSEGLPRYLGRGAR